MTTQNKLLVIVGPTATGKTSLGVRLAKKFAGEIVSADSRQVYRGMDIITGKDKDKGGNFQVGFYWLKGVKVWLYDIVQPDYRFNAADYVRAAVPVLKDIWQRGKLPILVGGTGFYIRALADGVETINVKPDWKLRRKLSNYQTAKLSNCLQKLDPEKWRQMNLSDRQNPRRLVRAIEVARQPATRRHYQSPVISRKLFIGLTAPHQFLYQRIDERVQQRVAAGAEREAKKLFKQYGQNSVLPATIGYRQWQEFFAGRVNRSETIRRWQSAERAYARRQMTWFKKDGRVIWFDIQQRKWQDEVEGDVKQWLFEDDAKS